MRKITHPVALGVAGLITLRVAAWGARRLVEVALAEIDEALTLTWDEEEDAEPCVCGSTTHRSVLTAHVVTNGLLQNGMYGSLPVTVGFQYRDNDSLAVTMGVTLHVEQDGDVMGHDYQEWSYARELLDAALSVTDERMVGEGDVSVQYIPWVDEVWIWLTHTDGSKHRIEIEAEPVREFMVATYGMVPSDRECADVDGALDEILGHKA